MCNVFLNIAVSICLLLPALASALERPGEELQEVGIRPVLGNKVAISELTFTDSNGKKATLAEFASTTKPIIIVPAYYGCPRLCGLLLDGVSTLLKNLTLKLGTDFVLLTVSFNTAEKPRDAAQRAEHYWKLGQGAGVDPSNWHFLVGDKQNVDPLMNQIGFKYRPDGEEFAHTAAIVILTPHGEISQYFTGISFPPFDTRLALVEASKGEIGSPLDHVFLFCFRFDETQGRYTWAVFNLMRVGGLLTLFLLGGLIITLWRRERMQLNA